MNVKLQYSIHANLLEFESFLTLSVYNLLSSVTHCWNRLYYHNIYRLRGYGILPPVATLDSLLVGSHAFNVV